MGVKTLHDPTGQARNRFKATRLLQNRLTLAERKVKALFRTVPRTRRREAVIRNVEQVTVYDYQITATELEQLDQQIRALVREELLETQMERMPPGWWWQDVIELPYRQGTAEEVVDFNSLITAAIIALGLKRGLQVRKLDVGQVLQSLEYQTALNNVYVRNFSNIKTLTDRTADQVVGVINRGMEAGLTPTEIGQQISDRFDVSRSSAQRTAVTEVNKAYTDARMDAGDVAAAQTGLRAAVLHISALLPTTRKHHADRHGNSYTTAQQRKWWSEGVNRINCHCSVRSVLVDARGRVIDIELQEEIKAERSYFDE